MSCKHNFKWQAYSWPDDVDEEILIATQSSNKTEQTLFER